jgi:transposase
VTSSKLNLGFKRNKKIKEATMKTTMRTQKINMEKELILACDVGKGKITCHAEYEGKRDGDVLEGGFKNSGSEIKKNLVSIAMEARNRGYEGLCVICESSGGFEKRLLRTARALGHATWYVSGEAVSKMKAVESNDNEKSDEKDPRVIHMLGKMDKVFKDRQMSPNYRKLRILGGHYEDESVAAAKVRTEISSIADRLFPDLDFNSKLLYGNTGSALVELFGLNPWKIIDAGYESFVKKMRGMTRAGKMVLDKIWKGATSSTLQVIDEWEVEIYERRLVELYAEWELHKGRKECMRKEMLEIYRQLPEAGKLSRVGKGLEFQFARILAETGNPGDFKDARQILRYAGLNIRRRASGKYEGHNKISKKGRSLLRKVLYQCVFSSLICKGGIYHDYYQRKKKELASGMKAIVAVMRKALKMFYGIAVSENEFSMERVFICKAA